MKIMKKLFLTFFIITACCSIAQADWSVYNASGKFLGYTNEAPDKQYSGAIFNPILSKFFKIDLYFAQVEGLIGGSETPVGYGESDCSGIPYSSGAALNNTVISVHQLPAGITTYYSAGTPVQKSICSSSTLYDYVAKTGACNSYPECGPIRLFSPIRQVTLPFSVPVALPLKYMRNW
jgi:hypothetical protein